MNQATIQDGRVTVHPVQGRETQGGERLRGMLTMGARNTVTNQGVNRPGVVVQARVVKCYNCQKEDHFDNVLPANNNSLVHDNSTLKLLKHENDRLMELLISQDLVYTAVNSLASINDYKTTQQSFMDEYNETLVLKAELAKKHDMNEKLFTMNFRNDVHDLKIGVFLLKSNQQSKESFQNNRPSHNQDAHEFKDFLIINELQDQLKAKNISIKKLKEHIENIKGKNNNIATHVDYLQNAQENADILCEIVNHARELRPLDSDLSSACTFVTRVSSSAEASVSKLRINTKKDRISQTSSSNKTTNKVEDQPRIIKYSLNNRNRVFKTVRNANVKHSVLNVNSEFICGTCHKCMFDVIHDLCVSDYLNDVNDSVKSKSVKSRSSKSKKKKMWKPTGKVYTNVRYSWKPTGHIFTIDGKVLQIVLWYLDSGCSKNMTRQCSQLINFVSKFLGTVRFGNDQITKIMGYGDYQLGNVTILRVYYVEGLRHNLFSDDKSTLQNSGVTLIASTTELSTVNREERSKKAKKAYYGVIQEIWELHYNLTVIPLFKCKWVDNEKGVDVDEDGFTAVNLSTNGYKSEPFILAKLATQVFYVKDPNDQRLHVVLYSKRHIIGVESVVDEDEYDQFDEFPPFSVGITPSNDVLDDTTYLRSDHDEGLEV
uniref:Uncharacterized protein n=1 Tax=Tanacetum cinerariifolium TaxID=118510 RepID=A0A6L2MX27_TANCI|nr:hypothetical protein [Tanacetum cinerariifolium]